VSQPRQPIAGTLSGVAGQQVERWQQQEETETLCDAGK
jgi:hypothetical protein